MNPYLISRPWVSSLVLIGLAAWCGREFGELLGSTIARDVMSGLLAIPIAAYFWGRK